jgi:hypothetical protein
MTSWFRSSLQREANGHSIVFAVPKAFPGNELETLAGAINRSLQLAHETTEIPTNPEWPPEVSPNNDRSERSFGSPNALRYHVPYLRKAQARAIQQEAWRQLRIQPRFADMVFRHSVYPSIIRMERHERTLPLRMWEVGLIRFKGINISFGIPTRMKGIDREGIRRFFHMAFSYGSYYGN